MNVLRPPARPASFLFAPFPKRLYALFVNVKLVLVDLFCLRADHVPEQVVHHRAPPPLDLAQVHLAARPMVLNVVRDRVGGPADVGVLGAAVHQLAPGHAHLAKVFLGREPLAKHVKLFHQLFGVSVVGVVVARKTRLFLVVKLAIKPDEQRRRRHLARLVAEHWLGVVAGWVHGGMIFCAKRGSWVYFG